MSDMPKTVESSIFNIVGASGEETEANIRPAFDYYLLAVVFMLIGLGLVMIYSASAVTAANRFGDSAFYLKRQIIHVLIGLVAIIIGMSIPYMKYMKFVYWLLLGSIGCLALLLIPGIGVTAGRSTRWFRILGFSFQPTELMKLAFIIYLSYSLATKSIEKIRTFSIGFLPHLIVCGFIILLCLAQPDLGTSIMLALLMSSLLFVAGTKVTYLVSAFFIAIPVLAELIASSSMRMRRILAFLNPWQYRYDEAFQLVNSITSFGSGGVTGMGLGNGRQKIGYLPEAWTDFIFPIIGEELGLIGVIFTLALFGILIWRGIRIATRSRNEFGKYLAFGIITMIGFQTIINVGVTLSLLPTKGLTLPFISFGGSSLVICCLATGILLNISHYNEYPELLDKTAPVKSEKKKTRSRAARQPIVQEEPGASIVRPSGGDKIV